MKTRAREVIEHGDKLFGARRGLMTLWQTMAEQFYPIRADFTASKISGEEYASHLMTGRPALAHRDLGNALSAMLRPKGQAWFNARTDSEDLNQDSSVKQWLDGKADVMRRMMYDKRSQFIRATKQGDNDFVAFGQCAISVEPNRYRDGILYRAWHLRDVAWCENAELEIDIVHRKQSIEARNLVKLFPKTVAPAVQRLAEKEPYKEQNIRHVMMPSDEYDLKDVKKSRHPFTSIFVDVDNDTILEEVPAKRISYVIPRWVTVSGSPYAHSPATTIALPDARMLQQITLTLLESGQKAVDPPLKATREAVVGAVNAFNGGITWVDHEYDERMGKALEPLIDGSGLGLGWGEKREEKIERMIQEAFFLNVINLPEAMGGDKMTAYETQKRVEEYIRRALPLFEPMEVEYNGGLCEQTWNVAMDLGAFGSFEDMPKVLSRREINWQFESPLQSANDRVKSEAFNQASYLLRSAMELDQSVRRDFRLDVAFRDAMAGIAPAKWITPVEEAQQMKAQDAEAAAQAAAQQAQMQQLANVTDLAQRAGDAGSSIRSALEPAA